MKPEIRWSGKWVDAAGRALRRQMLDYNDRTFVCLLCPSAGTAANIMRAVALWCA